MCAYKKAMSVRQQAQIQARDYQSHINSASDSSRHNKNFTKLPNFNPNLNPPQQDRSCNHNLAHESPKHWLQMH